MLPKRGKRLVVSGGAVSGTVGCSIFFHLLNRHPIGNVGEMVDFPGVIDDDTEELLGVCSAFMGDAYYPYANFLDQTSVKEAVDYIQYMDILINALSDRRPAETYRLGTRYVTEAAIPGMKQRGGGIILFVSSPDPSFWNLEDATYAESLQNQLAPYGIRVRVVPPDLAVVRQVLVDLLSS